jgi:hypothetical protein
MASARALLDVAPLGPGDEDEWARFLAASDNGTLFHDLGFLAYHPTGRFRFEHLMVRRRAAVVALVPGGLSGPDERPVFASPLGASVGGPVIATGLPAIDALDLVEALQHYARARGWAGIELTLAPPAYNRQPSDTLPFALFCRGFRLQNRWLCHLLPLASGDIELYRSLFRATAANLVRAGRRKGITVVEGGDERLDAFLAVFGDTYARHRATATHSPEEIADLLRRLPQGVRIYLAMLGETPIAGILLLLQNDRVAYALYICMSTAHARDNGNVVAFAAVLDRLAERGYRWLDLGPSASDHHFNEGVAFFKEGLGAVGHCRDRWSWSALDGEPAREALD